MDVHSDPRPARPGRPDAEGGESTPQATTSYSGVDFLRQMSKERGMAKGIDPATCAHVDLWNNGAGLRCTACDYRPTKEEQRRWVDTGTIWSTPEGTVVAVFTNEQLAKDLYRVASDVRWHGVAMRQAILREAARRLHQDLVLQDEARRLVGEEA